MATVADLTLVIDIGKSRAKLLLMDAEGQVATQYDRPNASVASALGYPALDLAGLEAWMAHTLRQEPATARCARVIVSTHGAAFVGLAGDALAWAPMDYEFDVAAADPAMAALFDASVDPYAETMSPPLPLGLNAARQLHYLQHAHPAAWQRTDALLPYPQYWAWRLAGVRASEVSSLGCHTHLWRPAAGGFSRQAVTSGWAALFAPLQPAWAVLGRVQPAVAAAWGLPADCEVHVGVHDSNACLASHLASSIGGADHAALTLVSSGTWTVLMAPGAPTQDLAAQRQAQPDLLANVDVMGRATPTARFMGGRDYAALLVDAKPVLGPLAEQLSEVQTLVDASIFALRPLANGAAGHAAPRLQRAKHDLSPIAPAASDEMGLAPAARSALAALYCAQSTAALVEALWRQPAEPVLTAGAKALPHRVIVEGPLAHNALYLALLQQLLAASVLGSNCLASDDATEGTARGAWLLAQWGQQSTSALRPTVTALVKGLAAYQQRWQLLSSSAEPR